MTETQEKMQEKVAIITGASSGIRYSFADFYAKKFTQKRDFPLF